MRHKQIFPNFFLTFFELFFTDCHIQRTHQKVGGNIAGKSYGIEWIARQVGWWSEGENAAGQSTENRGERIFCCKKLFFFFFLKNYFFLKLDMWREQFQQLRECMPKTLKVNFFGIMFILCTICLSSIWSSCRKRCGVQRSAVNDWKFWKAVWLRLQKVVDQSKQWFEFYLFIFFFPLSVHVFGKYSPMWPKQPFDQIAVRLAVSNDFHAMFYFEVEILAMPEPKSVDL